MSCVVLTNHARERYKERTSMSKTRIERNAELAFENGIRREDVSGRLRRYIDSLYFENRSANNIRIYQGYVYIFSNRVLITVIQLPIKYKAAEQKMWKNMNKSTNVGR